MERPIAALNSVWLEELTWIEVRDALTEGKKTVTIPTGGIEQNGPYVALGKHNYVLQTACGFEHIIYIGDSGGNQRGMEAVATALNAKWGETVAHYIPEFYDNEGLTGRDLRQQRDGRAGLFGSGPRAWAARPRRLPDEPAANVRGLAPLPLLSRFPRPRWHPGDRATTPGGLAMSGGQRPPLITPFTWHRPAG